jgi:hypothetical protein
MPISILESLVVALPPIQSASSRTFVELTLVTHGGVNKRREENNSKRRKE